MLLILAGLWCHLRSLHGFLISAISHFPKWLFQMAMTLLEPSHLLPIDVFCGIFFSCSSLNVGGPQGSVLAFLLLASPTSRCRQLTALHLHYTFCCTSALFFSAMDASNEVLSKHLAFSCLPVWSPDPVFLPYSQSCWMEPLPARPCKPETRVTLSAFALFQLAHLIGPSVLSP